jgi:hypothetical protein
MGDKSPKSNHKKTAQKQLKASVKHKSPVAAAKKK